MSERVLVRGEKNMCLCNRMKGINKENSHTMQNVNSVY